MLLGSSLLERLSRIFGRRKASETSRAIVAYVAGQPVWTPSDYEAFAREGFQRNVYVFACVSKIAMACAGIMPLLYARGRSGKLTEIESPDHPLLRLLRRPNPRMGRARMMEHRVAYLELSGNSYLERVGPKNGPPKELYTLRPDLMRVKGGNAVEPIGGYQFTDGQIITFKDPAFIQHLKTFNPLHHWYGQSPIQAASRSIDQNNEGRAHNVALLQNGARPPGFLKTEGKLTAEQKNDIRERIKEKLAGSRNAGEWAILDGGLDWVASGLDMVDMQWFEGQKMSAVEIATAFGVPPELIGDSEHKTYASFPEARLAFYEETILPLMDWIYDEDNAWLAPLFGDGLVLDYDRDQIEALSEKRKRHWDMAISAFNSGLVDLNESRAMVEYEAVDGGDGLFKGAFGLQPIGATPPVPEIPPDDDLPPDGEKRRKAWHLDTEEKKAAWWKAVDQSRAGWTRSVNLAVSNRLNDERREIVGAIASAVSTSEASQRAERAITDQGDEWSRLLKATYLAVGRSFARGVWARLKSHVGPDRIKATDEEIEDVWKQIVSTWLDRNAGEKIKQITATTKKRVREQLALGVSEGESVEQLADRIDGYLEEIVPYRAELVARTEVISASNLGSQAAAKATGLPINREWIATRDDRTRESHEAVDGQVQPMDVPYQIEGDRLLFPGDGSLGASPENTIQCRCTEGYLVTGEAA